LFRLSTDAVGARRGFVRLPAFVTSSPLAPHAIRLKTPVFFTGFDKWAGGLDYLAFIP
jgi:hypothetical protein